MFLFFLLLLNIEKTHCSFQSSDSGIVNAMVLFQKSQGPFFEHLETIFSCRIDDVSELKNVTFYVNAGILSKIQDPQHRVHVRVFNLQHTVDEEWDFLLTMNGRSVDSKCHARQSRTKAFKNNSKYCACLPVNITEYLVPKSNHISAVWKCIYSRQILVQLVRSRSDEELIDEVKQRPILSPLKKRNFIRGVEELELIVSLLCPLTCLRIKYPVKGEECKHISCFDLGNILAYAREMAVWSCPICSKPVPFDSLRIDNFLTDALRGTQTDHQQISLYPNKPWEPCTETAIHKKKRRKLHNNEVECIELLDVTEKSTPLTPLPPPPISNTNPQRSEDCHEEIVLVSDDELGEPKSS